MGATDPFRKQHTDLVDTVTKLQGELDTERLSADASTARKLLSDLAGKLKMHLSMEDQVLYPRLLKHGDESVRSTAQRFVDEMGPLAKTFEAYMAKWPNSISISGDASTFVTETKGLIAALAARIERENKDLYDMADRAA